MSNEEKILAALAKLQADVDAIKSDISTLKNNGSVKSENQLPTKEQQLNFIRGLANLLDDDEKAAIGRYQEAEESRKAALHG
ncbi:MAG: hypothetical protein J5809_02560 [Selenomonadaceae bacterium]|nr:hypothetical protein [Selenomonadaceae bacterium]